MLPSRAAAVRYVLERYLHDRQVGGRLVPSLANAVRLGTYKSHCAVKECAKALGLHHPDKLTAIIRENRISDSGDLLVTCPVGWLSQNLLSH